MGKGKTLLFLFLPFIFNFTISFIISSYAAYSAWSRGLPPEEIGKEIMLTLFTYNFYWSILQIGFGLYAIKLMGGWTKVKQYYSGKSLLTPRNILLIILLAVFSQIVIMGLQFTTALMSYGSWEAYSQTWREVTSRLPLFSKIYLVAIAPFTAGIFEEIIWRLYGITSLEKYWSTRTANLIQAISFAIWHGFSLHTIATFIIGYVYGLVFIKRRKILLLTAAHIITDIIGFSLAFL